MTDINKIPDAGIIAERIFTSISVHDIQKDLIRKILEEWNEEWIDYIAENKTGLSDGTGRSNEKRLKRRIDKLGEVSKPPIDDPGF